MTSVKTDNIIQTKTFEFSLLIISLYSTLLENREYVLSKQLLRSATSIGANVEEAIAGQSRKDFISKMSIASKEARESLYWLRLLQKSQLVAYDYEPYIAKAEEIVRIITAIVKSSQNS